jgi:hypothetical protein
MKRIANIISTGHYVPERRVTNAELKERFTGLGLPEVVDKLEASSGILQRYYAPEDWATSDLALPAAQQALERAGRKPEDVDLIILGTDSPDYITPATSTVLQEKLGAKNAGTFDVVCACASFPTAVASAAGLIATNPAINTVLVLGVSGDYFEHANTVIQMHDYLPRDVTAEAHRIASDHRSERRREAESELTRPAPRPLPAARLDASVRPGKTRVRVRATETLIYGRRDIDLRAVEQLVDSSQLRSIGLLMQRLHDRGGTIADPVVAVLELLEEPVTAWSVRPDGDLARPRLMEVLAAINRLRGSEG